MFTWLVPLLLASLPFIAPWLAERARIHYGCASYQPGTTGRRGEVEHSGLLQRAKAEGAGQPSTSASPLT